MKDKLRKESFLKLRDNLKALRLLSEKKKTYEKKAQTQHNFFSKDRDKNKDKDKDKDKDKEKDKDKDKDEDKDKEDKIKDMDKENEN
jgi:hypothetical protein